MNTEDQIPVMVAGANGKMGREVVQTVLQQVDLRLVAALGHTRGVSERNASGKHCSGCSGAKRSFGRSSVRG